MKYFFIFLIILASIFNGFSQTDNINNVNTQTITTYNYTLYDSGGPTGQYGTSENFSVTFCSGTSDCMELSFISFQTEGSSFDNVFIYDGNSIGATLLGTLGGAALPANIITSGPCVTIRFESDGFVEQDGFEIDITCTPNCYVPPPPPTNNDPCSSVNLLVDTICVSTTGTTLSATNSAIPDPTCAASYNGSDVWFNAIVPASGLLEINLAQATPGMADAGIALYTGGDCANLTEYACNEPWGGFPGSEYVMSSSGLAGDTIWIRVWEPGNDNQGAFDICAVEPDPFLEIDNTIYTPQQLIEDVLITGCLEAFNVVYDGDSTAIAYFNNGQVFGMQSGVVMASGSAAVITGGTDQVMGQETTQADVEADLSTISQLNGGASDIHDEAIIEFDFIPSSDTTEFDFVFASSEYPTYEFSSYNDVFAFFVSGPGITGAYADNAINVALVPGTTAPITISSVNGTTNPAFFAGYTGGTNPFFNVGGYTTKITAIMGGLTPCETYHIKFAISDAGDGSLSSYVFFEESSFSSGGDVSMGNTSTVGTDVDIYEGCSNYWIFDRIDTTAEAMLDTIHIDLLIGGTATENTDYTLNTTNLVILPGEYYDTLFYNALWDGVAESNEYIVFELLNGCPCNQQSTNDTIWIFDNFQLNPVITDDMLICNNTEVTVDVTINPLQDASLVDYLWSDGSTGTSITYTPTVTETIWVNASTPCQQDTTVEMTIIVVPPIDSSFAISKDSICIGEEIAITFTGSATSFATFNWDFDSGNPATATGQGPHAVSYNTEGDKIITLDIDDNGCLANNSLNVYVSPVPTITITPTNNLCNGNCNGELLAQPQGNFLPYLFVWSDGQTTNPSTGLCVGQYDVSFTNNLGCVSSGNSTITEPTQITSSTSFVDVLCFGGHNGSASITVNNGTPPYSYNWEGPNSYTGNTATINSLYAGTYNVTVTDANNCEIINTVSISQPLELLASEIEPFNINCYEASDGKILLSPVGGTPTYSYLWSNGTVTQNLINVGPGVYDVIITDINGCVGYNSATLTQPTELVNNSTTIVDNVCFGNTAGSITIDINGGVTPYLITWSNGATNTEYIESLLYGTYEVTIVDTNNCTLIIDSIDILEPTELVASITPSGTICIGETRELLASVSGGLPTYQYLWNTTENTDRINVSPTDTTTYTVTITDINNCIAITNRTIDVFAPITMELNSNIYSVCPSDPIILTSTVTGGNGNYTYTLNTGENVNSTHIVYPASSVSYAITVTDNCGSPSDNGMVDIQTYPLPSLSFSSDLLNGCEPLTVNFNEQSEEEVAKYYWKFGDGNTSSKRNPQHTFENSGIYDISLELTSYDGCRNFLQVNKMIEVYKNPIATFSTRPQTVSVIKPEVWFDNISQGNDYNHWRFGDGRMSHNKSPVHNYKPVSENYLVRLIVETEHGCLDSAFTEIIVVNEYTMYVPTAFSPDGDGINDKFIVVGNGVDLDVFNIKIYNRWGEVIFETKDMNYSWNGKTASGKYVQSGVYSWIVTYQDENGIEYQRSGKLTVIR